MLTKVKFNYNDAADKAIIDAYKVKSPTSGYLNYFYAGESLYDRDITKQIGGKPYKLWMDPAGKQAYYWVSGIIENEDNSYSAYRSHSN